jgi:hypothetical protein
MEESANKVGDSIKGIQLMLNDDSITVYASLMQGVLTTRVFEGTDCYLKFINFLREAFPDRHISIFAEIVVADQKCKD